MQAKDVQGAPSASPGGEPAEGLSAPAQLLAQVRELEGRLADLRAELERRSRLAELGLLAGVLAHEFENLWTPVRLAAQVARRHPGDRTASARAHEVAERAGARAGAVARTVLDLASPDRRSNERRGGCSGGDRAADQACDARAVAEEAMDLARAGIGEGVSVRLELDEPLRLAAPAGGLMQVVLNLVLNSARAGARQIVVAGGVGGIEDGARGECSTWNIRAHGQRDREGGARERWAAVELVRVVDVGCVGLGWLAVEDDGAGMGADQLGRLGEPFAAVGSVGAAAGGYGLGLYLVRVLVERWGGGVRVESAAGQGTRVVVTLGAA